MIGFLVRQQLRDVRLVAPLSMALAQTVIMKELAILADAPLLAIMLLMTRERATAFESALPLHARTLLLTRTAIVLVSVLVTLAIALVPAVQHRGILDARVSPLDVLAVATLAVLLPVCVRTADRRGAPLLALLFTWVALAGAGALLVITAPVAVRVLCYGVAIVGTGTLVWRRAPATFETVPTRGSVAASSSAQSSSAQSSSAQSSSAASFTSLRRWWTQLRDAATWEVLFSWLMALFIGVSGTPGMLFGLLAVQGFEPLRKRTQWSEGLPLSHAFRLNHRLLLGPVLCVVLFGAASNIARPLWPGLNALDEGAPYTRRIDGGFDSPTRVPFEYWAPARGDSAPVIRAAWGETAPAYTLKVFGVTYFNPYTVRATSSSAFLDWQFRRATQAVYGDELDRSTYQPDAAPRRVTFGLRMQLLEGSAMLLYTMLLLAMAIVQRPWMYARTILLRLQALMPIALAVQTLTDFTYQATGSSVTFALGQRALLQLNHYLNSVAPDSLVLVFVVALVPLVAMYVLLRVLAERVTPIR